MKYTNDGQLLQKWNLRVTIELQDGHLHFNHTSNPCSETGLDLTFLNMWKKMVCNVTVNTKESTSDSKKDETTKAKRMDLPENVIKMNVNKVKTEIASG